MRCFWQVQLWVPINEQNMYCAYFNSLYVQVGDRTDEESEPYQCLHNFLLGHLEASRAFKRGKYTGKTRVQQTVQENELSGSIDLRLTTINSFGHLIISPRYMPKEIFWGKNKC